MCSCAECNSLNPGSAIYLHRRESSHPTLSKVIRIILATMGTIASYAFLPPVGATVITPSQSEGLDKYEQPQGLPSNFQYFIPLKSNQFI